MVVYPLHPYTLDGSLQPWIEKCYNLHLVNLDPCVMTTLALSLGMQIYVVNAQYDPVLVMLSIVTTVTPH